MRLAFLRCIIPVLLVLGGCEPSWRAMYPQNAKLYDKGSHQYFGKVIGFELRHDFHNGTPPDAAILIQPASADEAPVWGSCTTCAATFQTGTP